MVQVIEKINKVFTRDVRLYIYAIMVAGFGLLAIYGIINDEQMAAWLLLSSAICGLAAINVPPKGVK